MKTINPPAPQRRRRPIAAAAATMLFAALTTSFPQAASDITPPPVPANLIVPDTFKAYFIGHALGTQNYVCLPSGAAFKWTLFGPQATLFDDDNEQVITHFFSPNPVENGVIRATWQHSKDTSAVWGRAVETSTDSNFVAPGAIAWLKIQIVGAQYGPDWGDKLTATTYIQRVKTAGGTAPATGCTVPAEVGNVLFVPYTADYVFYRLK
jgi:Protein of unknown function (DUF3455)